MKKILKWLSISAVALVVVATVVGCYYSTKLKYTYNNADAVAYARQNAHSKSKNLCALYVRESLEAGGCPTFLYPRAACHYVDFLVGLGFEEVAKEAPHQLGDIVVFEAVSGHPYGHIAIWDGTHWISDFHQKNIIVNKAYRTIEPRFFRQTDGPHKRKMWATNPTATTWQEVKYTLKILYRKIKRSIL